MRQLAAIAICLSCARPAPAVAPVVLPDAAPAKHDVSIEPPLGTVYVARLTAAGAESDGEVSLERFTEDVGKCRTSAPPGQRHGYVLMTVTLSMSQSLVERGGVSDELAACVMKAVRAVKAPMSPSSELWYVRLT